PPLTLFPYTTLFRSAAYYVFFVPQGQFCAINPRGYSTATCHGDSGGPAIALDAAGGLVELGITSLGEPECSTYEPSVFTRVDRRSEEHTSELQSRGH